MSWHAKRTGGYTSDSQEFADNVLQIYDFLSHDTYLIGDVWSYEAIVGVLCNMAQESNMNPWIYNGSRYGLVQFTFNYYRQQGSRYSAYAPSTSPSATSDGAKPSDGQAQLQVIDAPSNTLYLANERRKQLARDLNWSILEWTDLQSYKTCDDIDEAIQAWLLFYEYPESTVAGMQEEFAKRVAYKNRIIEILGGTPPTPPDPPIPPTPTSRRGMPLYFYITKKFKRKKGLI